MASSMVPLMISWFTCTACLHPMRYALLTTCCLSEESRMVSMSRMCVTNERSRPWDPSLAAE
jgi:hypothetical protein